MNKPYGILIHIIQASKNKKPNWMICLNPQDLLKLINLRAAACECGRFLFSSEFVSFQQVRTTCMLYNFIQNFYPKFDYSAYKKTSFRWSHAILWTKSFHLKLLWLLPFKCKFYA